MDKISIITACHNSSDSLKRCWDSLKRQTYGLENLECIFVDDASDDEGKTLDVLYKIESEAPDNVIVISSETNRGPGGAINIGLSYASGRYLQILDSDDELRDDALSLLHSLALEYDTDIIQYNHLLIRGDQRRVNMVSTENKLYVIDDHQKRVEFLNATLVTYGRSNKFYKMDLIRDTGVRFAENAVYEEPLFVYPLFLYANRVYLFVEGLYYYYLHDGSIVTSQIGKRLTDHPRVQMMVLKDCMSRGSLYEDYRDVISCYFLWSYYCETLMFAAEQAHAKLSFEFFCEMQRICRTLYPDFRNNPQIRRIEDKQTLDILKTIDRDFADQNELDAYIRSIREKAYE